MHPARLGPVAFAVLALSACAAPDQSPEHVGQVEDAINNVCPGATVSGIDIASYQHPNGAGIDWGQVAQSQSFVVIKATENNGYSNDYYAGDYAGAKGAGITAGSYHFLAPSSQTGVSGAAQAQHFLAHSSYQAGDLPPMLDVETSSLYNSVLPSVADVTSWLDTVEGALGVKPLIYIGYYVIGDLGTPAAIGGYPINIPNYSTCPSYPDSYPAANLVMWQNTSSQHVNGITGNVDHDEFYGDMAAFQAFVHADQAATGYLDHAACDTVNGWGWDPDDKMSSTHVDVYYNGAAGDPGAAGVRTDANVSRDDLCQALGSCNHAFSMATPRSLFDGANHAVHAYAIDLNGSENGELNQSPQTIQCAPLALPADTVKRWVTDPTVFTAWNFSSFQDVAPIDQASVNAEPDGAKIDAGPVCVQADDGTPEVWVIDQGMRRHVINPDSLAAWRFTVAKTPAAQVYANAKGPDWPASPALIKGADKPNIYVLDVKLHDGSGSGGGSGTGAGHVTGTSSGPGGHHPPSGSGGAGGGNGDASGDDGGCSAAPSGDRSPAGWMAFVGLAMATSWKRWKRRAP